MDGRNRLRRRAHVQREGRRDDTDQNEDDEAHALLTVVRTVRKAHSRACRNEQSANPARRRCLVLRSLEQRRIAKHPLRDPDEESRDDESNQRRKNERFDRVLHLAPIDPISEGAVGAHDGIHQADADNRADERMRARGRQTEVPRT